MYIYICIKLQTRNVRHPKMKIEIVFLYQDQVTCVRILLGTVSKYIKSVKVKER